MTAFLRGFDAAVLLAPLDPETFFAETWDRVPVVLNRNLPDFYDGLLDVAEIDAMLAQDPARIFVADARAGDGRRAMIDNRSGALSVDAVLARVALGATLIVDHADRRLIGLARLCRMLTVEWGYPCHTNIYLTPPDGQGFAAHQDDTGVFVLQIRGSKTWRLGAAQRSRPITGEDGGAVTDDTLDRVERLEPGDMLYIPRGWAHAAEAGETGSVHITLTVSAPAWADVLGAAPPPDSDLRDLLPVGFHKIDQGVLASMLAGRSSADDADVRLSDFARALVGRFRPDMTGRLTAILDRPACTDTTKTRPRDDVRWHIERDDAECRLYCGPIQLAFPARAEPAIRTLLTRTVTIDELPGDVTGEERQALAACLIDHALVRRRPA